MRVNRKQKLKLAAGVLLTLQILFVFPWIGWDLTNGNKAALIVGLWLLVGMRVWQRRERC
jgi:hypothetical protein